MSALGANRTRRDGRNDVNDPACVKTHTIAKCRKYNSPTRYRTSCAEHDPTPWCAISLRCFYVRGGRWSFRTAKTRSGHIAMMVSRTQFVGEVVQVFPDHVHRH